LNPFFIAANLSLMTAVAFAYNAFLSETTKLCIILFFLLTALLGYAALQKKCTSREDQDMDDEKRAAHTTLALLHEKSSDHD
jgi:preprotein translocase subunit SecG